jgi:hypothetical protein
MADLASSSSPTAPPSSPSPTCRLTVAHVGDRDGRWQPAHGDPIGLEFVATPVLGTDGHTLVAAGVGTDGVLRLWAGAPMALERVTELPVGHRPLALTRVHGRWHLFGVDPAGRPCHATSGDLVTWVDDGSFAREHPHVLVRGATAVDDHVVVLAEVVVQGRSMGWSLLHGAEDPAVVGGFRAREITFPLTPDHRVVGPAHVRDDEIALVVTSPTTRMVARTVPGTGGRSWTLALVAVPVVPTVVLARGRDVWVAGDDPRSGAPLIAMSGGGDATLDRAGGAVCAAVFHGDLLVMARCPVAPEPDDDAQSSPAYISSISLA